MMNSKEIHLRLTSNIRLTLVWAICIIYAVCLWILTSSPIPADNRSAIDILVGSMSTLLGMVFTYYFGNSAGSGKRVEDTPVQEESND